MKFRRRKPKKMEKLNVIPILDAVFIFIFFLLMSAQFLKVYEIGSDAPAVTTIDNKKDKRPPLNLILDITKTQIVVKTGLDENVVKSIPMKEKDYDHKALVKVLVELKKNNMDESSIIFRPKSKVPYKKLVKIMDTVRNLEVGKIDGRNKKGKVVETTTLFDQIIFETII